MSKLWLVKVDYNSHGCRRFIVRADSKSGADHLAKETCTSVSIPDFVTSSLQLPINGPEMILKEII